MSHLFHPVRSGLKGHQLHNMVDLRSKCMIDGCNRRVFRALMFVRLLGRGRPMIMILIQITWFQSGDSMCISMAHE
jgi:hypothetical protein